MPDGTEVDWTFPPVGREQAGDSVHARPVYTGTCRPGVAVRANCRGLGGRRGHRA